MSQPTDINIPSSTGSIFRQNRSSLVMIATKKHITARFNAFYEVRIMDSRSQNYGKSKSKLWTVEVQIMDSRSPNYEPWKRCTAFRNQCNKLTEFMLTPNQLFPSSQMFPFLSTVVSSILKRSLQDSFSPLLLSVAFHLIYVTHPVCPSL